MREQRQPELVAALEDAAAECAVIEARERNLHCCDRRELERLVELPAVDVRDPDAPNEALVREPGERAQRGPPRRSRIGRVEEIEVDRQAVERVEARLAVGADRLRAAVRAPTHRRAGTMPPFVTTRALCSAPQRRNASASSRSLPSYARAVSKTVMPGRRRRRNRLHGRLGREPHAAEPDAELRRVEPGRRHADVYSSNCCRRATSSGVGSSNANEPYSTSPARS